MLDIKCICGEDVTEPGPLVFSPPDETGACRKYHFCLDCSLLLSALLIDICAKKLGATMEDIEGLFDEFLNAMRIDNESE